MDRIRNPARSISREKKNPVPIGECGMRVLRGQCVDGPRRWAVW